MTTQIQDWAQQEYLEEFDTVWTTYRNYVGKGITTCSELQIRDLFQALTIVQAHAEMRISIMESAKDAARVNLHLQEIRLLRVFNTGAMNKRMAEVNGHEDYQKVLEEYNDAEDNLTIVKGSAKAATIAANALSREISARLKN